MNSKQNEEEEQRRRWGARAWATLASLRSRSPLIQCITNFVSMDLMANTLLSAGASPAMLHSVEELPDFTPNIDALCINVGTLSAAWLPAMKIAAELAVKAGKPWVLDPVAAGASKFRMMVCLELMSMKPTVVRGNGSEIIALSKASTESSMVRLSIIFYTANDCSPFQYDCSISLLRNFCMQICKLGYICGRALFWIFFLFIPLVVQFCVWFNFRVICPNIIWINLSSRIQIYDFFIFFLVRDSNLGDRSCEYNFMLLTWPSSTSFNSPIVDCILVLDRIHV